MLGGQAAEQIVAGAGQERHDDLDRAGLRILLAVCRERQRQQGGQRDQHRAW